MWFQPCPWRNESVREWLKKWWLSQQTGGQWCLGPGPFWAGLFTRVGTRGHDLRPLIWENFRATERLLRDTISPIFFQSFPCRDWYIFNFSVSPLLYLRGRENRSQLSRNHKLKTCILTGHSAVLEAAEWGGPSGYQLPGSRALPLPALASHPWQWSESHSAVSAVSDSLDCTVHGILQARILEWVAFPFSRGSSQPKDWTQVSRTAGGVFTSWATREAHLTYGHPINRSPRSLARGLAHLRRG